jgi:Na+/H+ antiporter NhaD/arsenite permease-like protein
VSHVSAVYVFRKRMLVVFPLLAGLLASFVDSITVMLFLATLTIEIAKILKIDPVPLVVGEVVVCVPGGGSVRSTLCIRQ